jgi:hypothetical protein
MRTEDCLSRESATRPFGRKGVAAAAVAGPRSTLADDLKLFTLTFASGFLFMTLYLA